MQRSHRHAFRGLSFPVALLLGLLAGFTLPSASAAPESLFPDARDTLLGLPVSPVVGDFDGDGRLDVAAGAGEVFPGNGDATLARPRRYSVASLFGELAIADFNLDGVPDLAGNGRYNSGIELVLGAGDGSFGEVLPSGGTAGSGYSLAVADFDADGRLDIAHPQYAFNTVTVQLGNGDGTFGQDLVTPVGFYPTTVRAADLDGDGVRDLVVVNFWADDYDSLDLSVLRGRGDGSFHPEQRLAVDGCSYAYRVALADFNRDGRPDAAIGCNGSVRILPGEGDGTFGPALQVLSGPMDEQEIKVADLDGDGLLDLVVASGGLLVFLGNGDGTFRPGVPAPARAYGVGVGDLDADGRPDLVVDEGGRVVVLRGVGNGSFQRMPRVHQRFAAGDGPRAIAAGHLDGDGLVDLVTVNWNSDDVSVLLGRGDGTFATQIRSAVVGDQPQSLVLGDFDGDGSTDVATANVRSDDVSVLLGGGDGSLALHSTVPVAPLIESRKGMVAADFDRDGQLDIAVQTSYRIELLHGNGDGSFELLSPLETLGWATGMTGADLDGDGITDLITGVPGTEYPDTDVRVYRASGDGGFEPPADVTVSGLLGEILVADDFDGDGRTDVVIGYRSGARRFLLCRGGEGGTLSSCDDTWRSDYPRAAADFDGNGAPDLAGVVPGDDDFEVALNDGTATFVPALQSPSLRFAAGGDPVAMAVEDFNGDGRPDVAVANFVSDDVSVALNTGTLPSVPPTAKVVAPVEADCVDGSGTVTLDASSSTDLNSTPGTNDDIVAYDWFDHYPDSLVATGEVATLTVPLGQHHLVLEVIDTAGETNLASVEVSVVDRTPPELTVDLDRAILWPPNHRMVEVGAALTVSDACGSAAAVLGAAVSDEPDDEAGSGDGATVDDVQDADAGTLDTLVLLRAERDGTAGGRTYTLTYVATDEAGNTATAVRAVSVPRSVNGRTDPLSLSVAETPAGTRISWSAVAGANHYNAIRGSVDGLHEQPSAIRLGQITCLEAASTDTDTTGNEDAGVPPAGEAFFYLVEYDDGDPSGYGSESVPKAREPQAGGCE